MGIFSEEFKFHSTLQVILRFGLNSHCFDLISKRRHLVGIHVRLIEPVKRSMQFGFTVLGKKSIRKDCV